MCSHGYANWWACDRGCGPPGRSAELNHTEVAKHLLADLAAALDACQEAGLKPRLKHGAVYTRAGYILPPLKSGRWVVRTLADSGSAPPDDDPEDE